MNLHPPFIPNKSNDFSGIAYFMHIWVSDGMVLLFGDTNEAMLVRQGWGKVSGKSDERKVVLIKIWDWSLHYIHQFCNALITILVIGPNAICRLSQHIRKHAIAWIAFCRCRCLRFSEAELDHSLVLVHVIFFIHLVSVRSNTVGQKSHLFISRGGFWLKEDVGTE